MGDNRAMRCVLPALLLIACGPGLAACGKVPPADRAPDGGPSGGSDGAVDASGPVTITLTNQRVSGQTGNAALVAFQDGDGPWQAITGTDGVYKASVSAARYGTFVACERARDGAVFVALGFVAVTDGTERFTIDYCALENPVGVMISGTISGTQMGENVWVSDGFKEAAGALTSWNMEAFAGPGTLIGMRLTNNRPTAMLLQRVTYAAGATFNLDFANQFFPTESDLTLDPTGATTVMMTFYVDESGGVHRIDFTDKPVTKYRVVPADRVGGGMLLLQQNTGSTGATRQVQRAFKTPTSQVLTLPAAFLLPTPPRIATTMPYTIAEATLPRRSGASYYAVNYFTSENNVYRSWDSTYSAAWTAAVPGGELVLRVPDLSGVPGWKPSFALSDKGGSWNVGVGTGPARFMPGAARYDFRGQSLAPHMDGDEITTSYSTGTLQ
jgi:hypothetical protein